MLRSLIAESPCTRVVVVEDDPLVQGVIMQLLSRAGLDAIAYSHPSELLENPPEIDSGCFVLDMYLPEMTGLKLREELVKRGFAMPFIIITGMGNIPDAIDAIRGGAVDFLQKPFDAKKFLAVVRNAIDRDIATRETRDTYQQVAQMLATLSAREKEILELVVDAKLTKQIATVCGISVKTVEAHRTKIMRKLNVDSVVELVRLVVEHRSHEQATH